MKVKREIRLNNEGKTLKKKKNLMMKLGKNPSKKNP